MTAYDDHWLEGYHEGQEDALIHLKYTSEMDDGSGWAAISEPMQFAWAMWTLTHNILIAAGLEIALGTSALNILRSDACEFEKYYWRPGTQIAHMRFRGKES